jgi:hypothetical protein
MFLFAFRNYMEHGFPKVGSFLLSFISLGACAAAEQSHSAGEGSMLGRQEKRESQVWRAICAQDELRPISCRGHDSQGGLSVTLIDALDTLLVRALDAPLGNQQPE